MAPRKQGQRTLTKQNITLDRGAKARTLIQIGALNIDVSGRFLFGILLALVIQTGVIIAGNQGKIAWFSPPPKGEMTGTLNIALIPFGQMDENGIKAWAKGEKMADEIHQKLEAKYKDNDLKPEVRVVNVLTDSPIDEDKLNTGIHDLADSLKADWLVYGYLEQDKKELTIMSYLNTYRMPNARDLEGAHEILDPSTRDSVETNQAAYKEMLTQLGDQSESLANFGLGLGYFSMDQIEESQKYFSLAGILGIDSKLQKVIYLFQSKTKLVADDFGGARADLNQALSLDPNYARAMLGLGELDYLSARSGQVCSNPIPEFASEQTDLQGIALEYQPFEDALQHFQEARSANDENPQPAAFIPIKADYYTGRVYFCLSIAGLEDRWIDAQCSYWSVIYFARLEQDWLPDYCQPPEEYVSHRKEFSEVNDVRSKDPISRNLAAKAFTDLAVLNWQLGWELEQQGDSQESEQYYAHIEDYLQKAIEISDHIDEAALDHVFLASYYAAHDRCEDAKKQFQSASDQYFNVYLKDNPNLHIEDFEKFYTEVQNRYTCI
jgi:tetratricopeptide (TPR) repeat protein